MALSTETIESVINSLNTYQVRLGNYGREKYRIKTLGYYPNFSSISNLPITKDWRCFPNPWDKDLDVERFPANFKPAILDEKGCEIIYTSVKQNPHINSFRIQKSEYVGQADTTPPPIDVFCKWLYRPTLSSERFWTILGPYWASFDQAILNAEFEKVEILVKRCSFIRDHINSIAESQSITFLNMPERALGSLTDKLLTEVLRFNTLPWEAEGGRRMVMYYSGFTAFIDSQDWRNILNANCQIANAFGRSFGRFDAQTGCEDENINPHFVRKTSIAKLGLN